MAGKGNLRAYQCPTIEKLDVEETASGETPSDIEGAFSGHHRNREHNGAS